MDNVILQWDAVSGADGYRIFKYDESTQQYVKLADVKNDTTGYTVENLEEDTEYKFKIGAYKQVNAVNYWGDYSAETSVKTQQRHWKKFRDLPWRRSRTQHLNYVGNRWKVWMDIAFIV